MKVVCVIDCQNDFITGPLGSPEAVIARDNLAEYLKTLDYDNTEVIFTADTHNNGYLETREGKYLPISHCIEGTDGWDIDDELTYVVRDDRFFCVFKNTFGTFELITRVCNFGIDEIDEIIICGVCTDICVISNALILKAAFPEIDISVLANCCAGITPEKHEAALSVMESCQINIVRE